MNRLSSFYFYKMGVNKREIDSLNLISVERFYTFPMLIPYNQKYPFQTALPVGAIYWHHI